MVIYRVDQIVNEKTYEGGSFYSTKHFAECEAERKEEADRFTGEYGTTYKVVEIEV